MTDFSQLQSALAENFQGRVTNIHIQRGNELHFQIARGDALNLAKILSADFNAELQLMVANDRRADNPTQDAGRGKNLRPVHVGHVGSRQ